MRRITRQLVLLSCAICRAPKDGSATLHTPDDAVAVRRPDGVGVTGTVGQLEQGFSRDVVDPYGNFWLPYIDGQCRAIG